MGRTLAVLERLPGGGGPLPAFDDQACASGWPNAAVVGLLRRLRSGGAELWCHADLDGDGLRIDAYVVARTGAAPGA